MDDVAQWVLSLLVAALIALVGVIYHDLKKEIARLREWRHDLADPSIRMVGWIKERVEKLEKVIEKINERRQSKSRGQGDD